MYASRPNLHPHIDGIVLKQAKEKVKTNNNNNNNNNNIFDRYKWAYEIINPNYSSSSVLNRCLK